MPDFPVISPGLITCCRPRLSLTSLPRPCPGYYRSLLSLTTSLITCCRPRLSLTSLPRLCPGYYRSPLSLTTSSPISSWLLTCSAPWLHSSSRLPVLHLGPHHTRDREDLGEDLQIQGLLLVLLPSYNPPSISCVSKDHEIVHVLSIGWTVTLL